MHEMVQVRLRGLNGGGEAGRGSMGGRGKREDNCNNPGEA